jgi:uncharacterized repeat protein (TIGR01451 family)
MNSYHFIKLKLRSRFIFVVGIGLILALFWGNGSKLSWAAPEQNPHSQTVPPRPTETPEFLPTPPRGAQPTPTPRTVRDDEAAESDNNNDDDNDAGAEGEAGAQPATRPTGAAATESDNENALPGPSQPTPKAQKQDKPSTQASGQGNKGTVVPATAQQADLSLSKWVDNLTPRLGETITFTAIVSNSGPSRVTNVIIRDLLPPGLVFSSTFGNRGSYEPARGLWVINTIGQNKQVTMSLVVRVAETLPITMTAEVVAIDQFDPDSTPNNHLEIEDDQASVVLIPSGGNPLAVRIGNDPIGLRATSLSSRETLALSSGIDWLYWLGAIIVGIVFVFMGVQLVHRS